MLVMVKTMQLGLLFPDNIKLVEFMIVCICAEGGKAIPILLLSIEKQNKNNFYKDSLRTNEIKIRQELNGGRSV